ncbi:MAG: hypothetical protein SFV54_20640 [Bryobacteraceae bacterium]|nr:hypothetical protein [Bryobacteraceae bacterium]
MLSWRGPMTPRFAWFAHEVPMSRDTLLRPGVGFDRAEAQALRRALLTKPWLG